MAEHPKASYDPIPKLQLLQCPCCHSPLWLTIGMLQCPLPIFLHLLPEGPTGLGTVSPLTGLHILFLTYLLKISRTPFKNKGKLLCSGLYGRILDVATIFRTVTIQCVQCQKWQLLWYCSRRLRNGAVSGDLQKVKYTMGDVKWGGGCGAWWDGKKTQDLRDSKGQEADHGVPQGGNEAQGRTCARPPRAPEAPHTLLNDPHICLMTTCRRLGMGGSSHGSFQL